MNIGLISLSWVMISHSAIKMIGMISLDSQYDNLDLDAVVLLNM